MHVHTAVPIDTEKTGLHSTTDSAPQLIVLMVANIFNSSSNGSDCCCTNHSRHRNKFQMPRNGPKPTPIHDSNTGPKTTPTNHGPREKQSDKEQCSPHAKTPSSSKIKTCRTRLQAESSNSQTTFEKLHEGEN